VPIGEPEISSDFLEKRGGMTRFPVKNGKSIKESKVIDRIIDHE
jgi:hypothetical protein